MPPVAYGQLPPELARYAEAIERSRLPYIHVALHKPDKLARDFSQVVYSWDSL